MSATDSSRLERVFDIRCEELCTAAREYAKADRAGTLVISLQPLIRAAMRVAAARIRLHSSDDAIPRMIDALASIEVPK